MTPVESLKTVTAEGRPGIVVRHAPREPIRTATDVLAARITAEGAAAARDLGRQLSEWDAPVVWHSPIVRCGETAEALVEGLREGRPAGSAVRVAGPLPAIGGQYLVDPHAAMGEFVRDRAGFVRRWLDGDYPRTMVLPRDETARLQLAGMVAAWRAAQDADIAVFVTHDLNLLALREELIGVRHEDEGWIDCLDGLWLRLAGDSIRVGYGSRARELPLTKLGLRSEAEHTM